MPNHGLMLMISSSDPWVIAGLVVLILVGGVVLHRILTRAIAAADRKEHPLAAPLRATRNLILPVAVFWGVAQVAVSSRNDSTLIRVLETILWVFGIHAALSLINGVIFHAAKPESGRAQVPRLFLDLSRFFLVIIGSAIVYSAVWDKDLGGLLTALGVGSIVIGLALQDTLGNLFAGIALLFERPFTIGHWIRFGDHVGEVLEMNWRAVRIRTRTGDMIVVPNSSLGKDIIHNYSQPTAVHCHLWKIGFSYDDPPNKVKRVLLNCALHTSGITKNPEPIVRTSNYADSAIEYTVYLWIDDFARVNEILDNFTTRVWYAAKRASLTIPFPIRTIYQAQPPKPEDKDRNVTQMVQSIPVFVPLENDELESLAKSSTILAFGRGERIVHQGDPGDAMYVILEGTAVVALLDEQGAEREVARLSRGEFFGEMALLTGEPRSASVSAIDDLEVAMITSRQLKLMLERRPALAQEMAEIVESRRQGLRTVRELQSAAPARKAEIQAGASALATRIKRFFGL